jgi:hypothetical protein
MSYSKDCLNSSSSVTYPKTSPVSVPASYIQIQNELTPARSPGSCKVRFSEKSSKLSANSESIDKNRSLPIENTSFNEESKSVLQHQPSTTTAFTTKNTLSYNPSTSNGILPGKFYTIAISNGISNVLIIITEPTFHTLTNDNLSFLYIFIHKSESMH